MAYSQEQSVLKSEQEHIQDSHVSQLIAAFTASLVIGFNTILLRLISRRMSRVKLGWDDRISIESLVNYSPNAASCELGILYTNLLRPHVG